MGAYTKSSQWLPGRRRSQSGKRIRLVSKLIPNGPPYDMLKHWEKLALTSWLSVLTMLWGQIHILKNEVLSQTEIFIDSGVTHGPVIIGERVGLSGKLR